MPTAARTSILGCPVDILTLDETMALARDSMHTRTPRQHVALNVAKLVTARRDRELAQDIEQADIIGIDGVGISLALKLMGDGAAPRIAGADLFEHLMDMCAREGFKPYLLGAKQEVLERAMAVLQQKYPGLQFAGARNGYFDGKDAEVAAAIRAARPDCLFLAMPTPRKERFMARWRGEMDVPFVMGVGGTLDVVAGVVDRAPESVQKMGFEWLYRLLQEPRRMWRRYLTTNVAFAGLLARGMARRLLGLKP